MIRSESLLVDRERALEERLGVGVTALTVVQMRQVVQARNAGLTLTKPSAVRTDQEFGKINAWLDQ
jgi:hypothetical protein